MSAVLTALGALVLLLVLALAVPIDLEFRLHRAEAFEGRFTIGWLFGLLQFRLRIPRPAASRSARADRPERRAKAAAAEEGGRRRDRANWTALVRQNAFRRRLYRLVRDLVRAAHLRDVGVRLRLGLDDPADTGQLWGLVGPLTLAAQRLNNVRLSVEPEFSGAVVEVDAHGGARVVPIQFLALVVAFALSPPSVRAWRTIRSAHV